ncbi:2-succinyl-5-enolpyruvyl-6-hydroxy-3-cyclohexene-1-carboxylic-acid synthase [Marivirga sp. S37H4]|uniref:2-succinyl-5-enolpyruvyl-6-hydroxy-3-cyclohexene-1-carboxylate synthase n=1 Tax=Marivirga aurantiaca TaxID=2802615 RepID=A0A935C5E4_9BACT|nr:2-succinyl-5-enolpyruvyl-6-hydroxy-3-cyclohexene-1-carboxylic-acid synthase [Marivirga aurantiaca]MBK6263769.1 2-succinyl-5-enolpyruvyl-6-hydroxy-3-cyclohexene-1-carboxylic-acid synthase [Marivirga aurantiaca]
MSQISINNIAEICSQLGIRKAIISPGSRNAPLTLAFSRHPQFECFSISDERSAAFIGLGMAQADKNPVALICTSGSAALNYAPAVAEAFFQEVPLLVITADRPPEWIDQWDGQTIRQENIFGKHAKKSYHLPIDLSHQDVRMHAYRMVNEAIMECNSDAPGPVHLNIPFREPFYPTQGSEWSYNKDVPIMIKSTVETQLSTNAAEKLLGEFAKKSRIAFLLGQDDYSDLFLELVDTVSQRLNIPVFADVISNGHTLKNAVTLPDSICMNHHTATDETHIPELLISFGKSIISKNLKLFLRKNVSNQWHVSVERSFLADPFHSLKQLITASPVNFLSLFEKAVEKPSGFLEIWRQSNEESHEKTADFLTEQKIFNEFSALNFIMKGLPKESNLHLANSLSVRYANFIGLNPDNKIKVWANRGTSGIDGSNSTAMGHALAANEKQHFLITGDVAFFYDRNAFWHNYAYNNLKIILINNQGGSIFRMITGPQEQAELEEFFETRQMLNAKSLCKEFNILHLEADSYSILEDHLETFYQTKSTVILEIKSNSKHNQQIFEDFKNHLKS